MENPELTQPVMIEGFWTLLTWNNLKFSKNCVEAWVQSTSQLRGTQFFHLPGCLGETKVHSDDVTCDSKVFKRHFSGHILESCQAARIDCSGKLMHSFAPSIDNPVYILNSSKFLSCQSSDVRSKSWKFTDESPSHGSGITFAVWRVTPLRSQHPRDGSERGLWVQATERWTELMILQGQRLFGAALALASLESCS